MLSAISFWSDPGVDNLTTDYYLFFGLSVYETSKLTYTYNFFCVGTYLLTRFNKEEGVSESMFCLILTYYFY